MTRLAAVDCGTNSIRLLICDSTDGKIKEIHRTMEIVRLGEGVDETGHFSDAALARTANALEGYGHMGAYLGLFNGTICIPQIIAAAIGGVLLQMVGSVQSNMMIVAGVSLFLGALSVGIIKVKRPA
mgnify:CR=1 FL=1